MIEGLRPSWQTHRFNRDWGDFQGIEAGAWKGFFQQCHCTAALTGSQLPAMVWVLHLQVKMGSFGVTDNCPSLGTLLRGDWTHQHLFLANIWASEQWESNLVDSAGGFQSHWGFRAVGVWHSSGQITSPCATVSQCTEGWSQFPSTCRVLWDKLIQRAWF